MRGALTSPWATSTWHSDWHRAGGTQAADGLRWRGLRGGLALPPASPAPAAAPERAAPGRWGHGSRGLGAQGLDRAGGGREPGSRPSPARDMARPAGRCGGSVSPPRGQGRRLRPPACSRAQSSCPRGLGRRGFQKAPEGHCSPGPEGPGLYGALFTGSLGGGEGGRGRVGGQCWLPLHPHPRSQPAAGAQATHRQGAGP